MARVHGDALIAEIDLWNLENPSQANATLSADNTEINCTLATFNRPPLTQWSSLFGNSLAAMRACLDSIAWQIAHLDGASPINPKSLYFPILGKDEIKRWSKWKENVPNMPKELLDRFAAIPELNCGEITKALKALSTLNNLDKHRDALELSLKPDSASISLDVALGSPRETSSRAWVIDRFSRGTEVFIGMPILDIKWDRPFVSANSSFDLQVVPYVNVAEESEIEDYEDAVKALSWLWTNVDGALRYVCTGRLESKS